MPLVRGHPHGRAGIGPMDEARLVEVQASDVQTPHHDGVVAGHGGLDAHGGRHGPVGVDDRGAIRRVKEDGGGVVEVARGHELPAGNLKARNQHGRALREVVRRGVEEVGVHGHLHALGLDETADGHARRLAKAGDIARDARTWQQPDVGIGEVDAQDVHHHPVVEIPGRNGVGAARQVDALEQGLPRGQDGRGIHVEGEEGGQAGPHREGLPQAPAAPVIQVECLHVSVRSSDNRTRRWDPGCRRH